MKKRSFVPNDLFADVLLSTAAFVFLVSAVVFASVFAAKPQKPEQPPETLVFDAQCPNCDRPVKVAALNTAADRAALEALVEDNLRRTPEPVAAAPAVDPKKDWQALQLAARKYFPNEAGALPKKRIFRLTQDQIDASVTALLPDYVASSIKNTMARDPLQTNYEYAEFLSFNRANISSLSDWISRIAARVRKNPRGVINCAASGKSKICLKTEAQQFITRAFRGDVSNRKLDRIAKFYVAGVRTSGFAQATSDLVEIALNSPSFLFRRELDVDASGRLAPAQLLQSLTYTMADAPPEKLSLLSQQASRHLGSQADATATVDTILASQEARNKLMRFFKAWLEIREPQDFKTSSMIFPKFTPALARAMLGETEHFLHTHLSKPEPSLKDITQSTQSFISRPMAEIYNIPMKVSSNARLANHDTSQRLGIFSQPAVIASHSGPTDTRLIKRGVFWARKVMCMDLQPPPPGLDSSLSKAPHTTERSRVERSTRRSACAGCHKIINPLGFFQENYDALGRWRTRDRGYPVDASIKIDFLDEAPVQSTSPVEALKALTNSMKFKQCFVRQLFRFYMGRGEEDADHPLLRAMFLAFARNDEQNILKAIRTLAYSEQIAMRR